LNGFNKWTTVGKLKIISWSHFSQARNLVFGPEFLPLDIISRVWKFLEFLPLQNSAKSFTTWCSATLSKRAENSKLTEFPGAKISKFSPVDKISGVGNS
jgi:hypothetical protein